MKIIIQGIEIVNIPGKDITFNLFNQRGDDWPWSLNIVVGDVEIVDHNDLTLEQGLEKIQQYQ